MAPKGCVPLSRCASSVAAPGPTPLRQCCLRAALVRTHMVCASVQRAACSMQHTAGTLARACVRVIVRTRERLTLQRVREAALVAPTMCADPEVGLNIQYWYYNWRPSLDLAATPQQGHRAPAHDGSSPAIPACVHVHASTHPRTRASAHTPMHLHNGAANPHRHPCTYKHTQAHACMRPSNTHHQVLNAHRCAPVDN